MQGANRTARPFTGDYAGVLLYQTLYDLGLANQPTSVSYDDPLKLINLRIINAVKCVPPENKPLPDEIRTCNQYLRAEIAKLTSVRVYVALGRIAHDAILSAMDLKRSRFTFGHAAEHALDGSAPSHRLVSLQPVQHPDPTAHAGDVQSRAEQGEQAGQGISKAVTEFDSKGFVAALPRRPGVYRMYGAEGELLYVGKARSLKDRVGSYLQPRQDRAENLRARPADRQHRSHGDELRHRGAAARVQPDQAASAALQHRSARRQELSVHPAARKITTFRGSRSIAARAAKRAGTSARSPAPAQ